MINSVIRDRNISRAVRNVLDCYMLATCPHCGVQEPGVHFSDDGQIICMACCEEMTVCRTCGGDGVNGLARCSTCDGLGIVAVEEGEADEERRIMMNNETIGDIDELAEWLEEQRQATAQLRWSDFHKGCIMGLEMVLQKIGVDIERMVRPPNRFRSADEREDIAEKKLALCRQQHAQEKRDFADFLREYHKALLSHGFLGAVQAVIRIAQEAGIELRPEDDDDSAATD